MGVYLRTGSLCLIAAATVIGLAACGGGVPQGSVAVVGDAKITRKQFDHWLEVTARGQQEAQGRKKKKKKDPVPKKGTTEYNRMRDQVMGFLINTYWLQEEAKERGVNVSDADVTKRFDEVKKQFFPKKNEFEKFLRRSGQSQDDVRFRIRSELLGDKINQEVTKGKEKVSDQAVQDYYEKNGQQFKQPERRDLNAVLTKTKAKAEEARAAIESGTSFKQVAKSYSSDPSLKTSGGKLKAVSKGQNDKAFDKAVFGAKKGVLVGPVKTQFGYYVFEVTKIEKASTTSFKKAKANIRQTLISQNQQKALDEFLKEFEKKWKDRTECAKGYIVESCKNAPKPKTTKTGSQAPSPGGAGGSGK